MRHGGPNGRRPRGRHQGGGGHGGGHGGGGHGGHDRHGGGGGGQGGNGNISNSMNSMNRPRSAAALRHQTFDSHCLDVRVRGNAWQVCEKYQQLGRDATSSGDRVAAENYLQHAEHYFRIIEAINEATVAEQRQRGGPAPTPFGQQPEVPTNYFAPDGSLAQPPIAQPLGAPGAAAGASAAAPGAPPQQAQAEVTQKNPPPQQNPFFGNEEGDDQGGPEPLVARR